MCASRVPTGGPWGTLFVLTAACSAPDDPATWNYTPELVEPATFDAEAALTAIKASIQAARGYSPELGADAWAEALAVSPTCPDYYDAGTTEYWFECRERGRVFEGYVARYDYAEFSTAEWSYQGWYLLGEGALTDSSSGGFQLGGAAYRVSAEYTDDSGIAHFSGLSGTFQYGGAAATGTWLAAAAPVDSTWASFTSNPAGAGWVRLSATTAGLGGLYPDVQLSLWEFEAGASDCDLEPAGSASLRDTEGVWTDINFDAAWVGSTSQTRGACDGCGSAWRNGEALGEVCLDTPGILGEAP